MIFATLLTAKWNRILEAAAESYI